MTFQEKLFLILDYELIEKIEKCSHYFNCSTKNVIRLAIDELWNMRVEIYKRNQPIIDRVDKINQLELFS